MRRIEADRVSDLACAIEREEVLTDAALVEFVTNADTATCAAAVAGGGLRGLLRLTAAEAEAAGFSPSQRARLRALATLTERAASELLVRGTPMRDATTVFRHFHASMRELRVEQFRVLLLDGKHQVLRDVLVSQGTLTSSPVHPREVFAPAVRESAAAVVLVHNHPSGDPSPSADDLGITQRLCDAGKLLGVRVVDHVIIGDGTYCSLADRGLVLA